MSRLHFRTTQHSKTDRDANPFPKSFHNTFKPKSALTNAGSGNRFICLIGRVVRLYYLHKGFKQDNKLLPKGPILDVGDITLYPFQNFTIGTSLAPVTANLRDSSYTWLNESPDSVGDHYLLKSPIVHNHVGTGTHYTHFPP